MTQEKMSAAMQGSQESIPSAMIAQEVAIVNEFERSTQDGISAQQTIEASQAGNLMHDYQPEYVA